MWIRESVPKCSESGIEELASIAGKDHEDLASQLHSVENCGIILPVDEPHADRYLHSSRLSSTGNYCRTCFLSLSLSLNYNAHSCKDKSGRVCRTLGIFEKSQSWYPNMSVKH